MRSKLLFWNAKAGYYRKWSRWFRFVDSSFVTKQQKETYLKSHVEIEF